MMQDLAISPSISTVQAPHMPCSQPICVPVSKRCSRRKSARCVRGATSALTVRPFTVSAIAVIAPLRPWQRPARGAAAWMFSSLDIASEGPPHATPRASRADRASAISPGLAARRLGSRWGAAHVAPATARLHAALLIREGGRRSRRTRPGRSRSSKPTARRRRESGECGCRRGSHRPQLHLHATARTEIGERGAARAAR